MILPNQDLTLPERLAAPTPKFFKVVRKIGWIMATVGGIVAAIPLGVPAAVITVAGYLVAVGTSIAGVSYTAVDYTALAKQEQ